MSSEEEASLDDVDDFDAMGECAVDPVSPIVTSVDKEGNVSKMKKYMGVGFTNNFTMEAFLGQSQEDTQKRSQKQVPPLPPPNFPLPPGFISILFSFSLNLLSL